MGVIDCSSTRQSLCASKSGCWRASCSPSVQATWYGSSYPGHGYGGYTGYGWPCSGGSCSGYTLGYGGNAPSYGGYGQYYGAYTPSYGGYGQYAYSPRYGGYGHHYGGYSPSYGNHGHSSSHRNKRGAELIELPSKVANPYGENYAALKNDDLYSYYTMAAYQNWKHDFVKYSKNYRAPVRLIGTEREEKDHCIELTSAETKARRHVSYKEHEHLKHLSIKAIFRYFNQPTVFGLGQAVAKCGDKVACWTDTRLGDDMGMVVSDPFYSNEGCVAFSDLTVIDELCDAQEAADAAAAPEDITAAGDETSSFLEGIFNALARRSHPSLSTDMVQRLDFFLAFAGGYRECKVHLNAFIMYDSDLEKWTLNTGASQLTVIDE